MNGTPRGKPRVRKDKRLDIFFCSRIFAHRDILFTFGRENPCQKILQNLPKISLNRSSPSGIKKKAFKKLKWSRHSLPPSASGKRLQMKEKSTEGDNFLQRIILTDILGYNPIRKTQLSFYDIISLKERQQNPNIMNLFNYQYVI